MPGKVFIDTNVLVYLINEDSPYHKQTVSIIEKLSTQSEL